MGCPATRQAGDQRDENRNQLLNLTRQLSAQFRLQISRLDSMTKQRCNELELQVKKTTVSRSKYKQEQLLEQIVYKSHLQIIFKDLDVQLQLITQRSNYLELLNPKKITGPQDQDNKKAVELPIQTILFSLDLINDGTTSKKNADLLKFQNFIKTRYPTIKPIDKTRHQILNYYKKSRRPSRDMIKQFAFAFCQQKNLSVAILDTVGHDFRY